MACRACTTAPDYFLVTEYAEEGSLYSVLENVDAANPLYFDQMLQWALDIAHGIEYLHYGAPRKIIHRYVETANHFCVDYGI